MIQAPPPRRGSARPPLLSRFFLCAPFLFGACISPTATPDATVVLEGSGGRELGVATDYGIVFLGRSQTSGRIDYTLWYGDGPARESGIVEPLGGGLWVTESEILSPTSPLTFRTPERGEEVTVVTRSGNTTTRTSAFVARHRQVTGLLLELNSSLRALGNDEVGAGVYLETDFGLALVGLVAGRIRLPGSDGEEREFMSVVGPRELWRLPARERHHSERPPRIHREDIL